MLIPRSLRIDGSATFATVLSSMIMNSPTETAPSVHHFRFSGAKSLALTFRRLEKPVPFTRGPLRLDADSGAGRKRERHTARATPRRRALPRSAPHLDRGAGTILAGGRRGSRARVLGAVDRGRRRLARAGVGDLVRRRQAEPRLERRPPMGGERARRGGGGYLAARGRRARRADMARALRCGLPAGPGPRVDRRWRGGRGRDLPADVAAGRNRL